MMASTLSKTVGMHSPTYKLYAALPGGDLKGIEAALDAGARVNHVDVEVGSPLTAAVEARRLGAVQALLRAGAEPNLVDAQGFAPLWFAFDGEREGFKIAKALLRAGADPFWEGPRGSLIDKARAWGFLGSVELVRHFQLGALRAKGPEGAERERAICEIAASVGALDRLDKRQEALEAQCPRPAAWRWAGPARAPQAR